MRININNPKFFRNLCIHHKCQQPTNICMHLLGWNWMKKEGVPKVPNMFVWAAFFWWREWLSTQTGEGVFSHTAVELEYRPLLKQMISMQMVAKFCHVPWTFWTRVLLCLLLHKLLKLPTCKGRAWSLQSQRDRFLRINDVQVQGKAWTPCVPHASWASWLSLSVFILIGTNTERREHMVVVKQARKGRQASDTQALCILCCLMALANITYICLTTVKCKTWHEASASAEWSPSLRPLLTKRIWKHVDSLSLSCSSEIATKNSKYLAMHAAMNTPTVYRNWTSSGVVSSEHCQGHRNENRSITLRPRLSSLPGLDWIRHSWGNPHIVRREHRNLWC